MVNLVSPWWLQWIIGYVCLSVCQSVCVLLCSHDNDTKCSRAKSLPRWNVWSKSLTFFVWLFFKPYAACVIYYQKCSTICRMGQLTKAPSSLRNFLCHHCSGFYQLHLLSDGDLSSDSSNANVRTMCAVNQFTFSYMKTTRCIGA